MMNSFLGPAAGGLSSLMLKTLIKHCKYRKQPEKAKQIQLDPFALLNGILGGLVAVTANCAFVDYWAAVVIGILSGGVYLGFSKCLKKLEIDDPSDSFAVHGGCGMLGIMMTAFFHMRSGVFYSYDDYGDKGR
jgi:ammonia channel protein AmtB